MLVIRAVSSTLSGGPNTYRPVVARFALALATLLLVAGCSSAGQDDSAAAGSTAAGRTSAGESAVQPNGVAGSSTARSAPSVPPDGTVSKGTYTDRGGVWPLTVTKGALACQAGTQVLFTTPDGSVYAVNAAAQADEEWDDIGRIRADDPKHPGRTLPLDDLIASGEALC